MEVRVESHAELLPVSQPQDKAEHRADDVPASLAIQVVVAGHHPQMGVLKRCALGIQKSGEIGTSRRPIVVCGYHLLPFRVVGPAVGVELWPSALGDQAQHADSLH